MSKIILIVTKNRGEGYGGSDYCPIPFKVEVFEEGEYEKAEALFKTCLKNYIPDWKDHLTDSFDVEGMSNKELLHAAMEEGSSNDDYSVNLCNEGYDADECGLYVSPKS